MNHPTRAALYVRKSKREDTKQVRSLADQERELRAYATDRGYQVVQVYSDSQSGVDEKRPQFQQMIADASSGAGEFEVIAVYDESRFGRFGADMAGYFRTILREAGVRVESPNVPQGRDGRIVRGVMSTVAQMYVEDLARAAMRGAMSRAKSGQRMGGTPPYGYDIADYLDGVLQQRLVYEGRRRVEPEGPIVNPRFERRLVPSRRVERIEAVRLIFELAAEGVGSKAIALELDGRGVRPPLARQWNQRSVGNILANRKYLGHSVWGLRSSGKFVNVVSGEQVERAEHERGRYRPAREGVEHAVEVRDTHEPLISQDLWDRAHGVKGRLRAKALRGKGANSDYALSGLLVCANCGSSMSGKRNTNQRGVRYWYYQCVERAHRGQDGCAAPRVRREALEQSVLGALGDYLDELGEALPKAAFARGLKDAIRAGSVTSQRDVRPLERRLEALQRQISGDVKADGPTLRQIRALREEIAVVRGPGPVSMDVERAVRSALDQVASWRDALALEDRKQLKTALRTLVMSLVADTAEGRFQVTVRQPLPEGSSWPQPLHPSCSPTFAGSPPAPRATPAWGSRSCSPRTRACSSP